MARSTTESKRSQKISYSQGALMEETQLRKASADEMYCPHHVSDWCLSRQKRCFDVVLSVLCLILFLPLMALIALLIRMTSEGPALFLQERVGLHQKGFVIFKFRTMKIHSERLDCGPTVTRHGDPRMTKLGTLLRKLKFDELPQLINVLRGDMSFVGPRPKIAEHENLSMLCRPGITGAATIHFSHEEGMTKGIPEELVEQYVTTVLNPQKCKLDVHYMETASFLSDLTILLDTLLRLIHRSRRTAPSASIVGTSSAALPLLDDEKFVNQELVRDQLRQSA